MFEHLTDMGRMSVNKTMTVEFISVGGQAFREYAKSAEFGKGGILYILTMIPRIMKLS